MAGMRVCTVCGIEFYDASKNHSKITCSNKCRDVLIYQDEDKKFYRSVQMRLAVLKRKYGVVFDPETIEHIKADLKVGRCTICKRERKEDERDFHIDHDHVTGKYRGILCPQCNYALGNIFDSPLHAIELCKYLIAKKARGIDFTKGIYGNTIEDEAQTLMDMVKI